MSSGNTPTSSEETIQVASLGLRGTLAVLANFSAVVILTALFIIQNREISMQAREDRAVYREETGKQWELVRQNQIQLYRLTSAVENNQRETARLAQAIEKIIKEKK